MPERVRDLSDFLREIIDLLELIVQCQRILFRRGFRENLPEAVEEAVSQLRGFVQHEYVRHPELFTEMQSAGLSGSQLELKLESFESELTNFDEEAGQHHLEGVFDKGATILGSLAGAIPGFGSFAQELVDFLLKELKKRLRFWRR